MKLLKKLKQKRKAINQAIDYFESVEAESKRKSKSKKAIKSGGSDVVQMKSKRK
jgi:hypothetical protein